MNNWHSFLKARALVIGAIALLNVLAQPAFAQFTLVSVSPANGATAVPSPATLVSQFSAPLDTSARFEEPGDFYLGLQLFPEDSAGVPTAISISADLKTVTMQDVSLTADTKFVLMLTGAKSTTGEMLAHPYAITFSTGATLPTGSISGQVTFSGGDPAGTAVGVFRTSPFAERDSDPEAIAIVPTGSNQYTINYIPGGSYVLFALLDTDGDGDFRFGEDASGGHDANGDEVADRVLLPAGSHLTGIDVVLSIPMPVTARQNFAKAQTLAQAIFADAALAAMQGGSISPQGESPMWIYAFYSAANDTIVGVSKLGSLFFILPNIFQDDDPEGPPLNTLLPDDWIDSDVAADSAEANGGSDFRSTYPDAESFAALVNLPRRPGPLRFADRAFAGSGIGHAITIPGMAGHNPKLPWLQQQPVAAWVFFYESQQAGQFLQIMLDAQTGSKIEFPGPGGQPTTAQMNLPATNQAATQWANDAVLVQVGTINPVGPKGFADAWGYAYYSAAKDSVLGLWGTSGAVVGGDTTTKDQVKSVDALPPAWLDSPVIMSIAEPASNNFRAQHADAQVWAGLSRGTLASDPSRALWEVTYISTADTAGLQIHIDAVDGNIITGIAADTPDAVPTSFALEQNYPNPFNPLTVISYRLPVVSRVDLAIYNTLGQKVATLVSERQAAGIHRYLWDASGLASGVYLYRLQAGEFVQVRKLILMQ